MNAMQEIESGNFAVPRWLFVPPDSVRVVSWNIDRGLKLSGVIDFLAGAKADIILLQEADLNARRTHHINVAREIAQTLEMNYVFGREFQELTQGSKASPAYHGQATLSRWPLSNSRIIRFQKQSHFWRPHWFLPDIAPFQERLGGRMALVSAVNIAGKTMISYNLHLDTVGTRPFCLPETSISMYPKLLRQLPSAALSFRTPLLTNTCLRHLAHFWSMGESSIGSSRGVAFA